MAELEAAQPAGSFTDGTHGAPSSGEREDVPLPSAGVTTEIIQSIEGIRALKPDYDRLLQVTGNTLPFALHEWHLAWCAHFLKHDPQVDDQPFFCVVRDAACTCVAIVPLIVTRRRLGPLTLVVAAPIGADPGLTEIRGPLVEPGYEEVTVQVVHESLARLGAWDWIQWSGLNEAMAGALARETSPQWYEVTEDYVLDLPPTWQEFRPHLTRNMRESLRHCYNSLRRDRHSFEFVVAREQQEVRQALGRFLQLHALRANMTRGPKHPDRFAGKMPQAFLYDVCERLAARDAVRVFQLKIGGDVVASRIGFLAGDCLYLYYSGFDPAWARYSVMTTTVAEAFRYLMTQGIRTVNLSPIAERSKIRWRPRRLEFRSALVNRQSAGSRVACMAYRLVRSGNGAPIQMLRRFFWAHRNWS